ncbi:hypothetical protein BN946_scf185011.g3 [Trametes cinnabarina]|uniref:DUF6697 domain-containing protein n=1 Tax=Pycnoporus cinnabarinus TaxID=5643 RepID=A0A060SVX3_PYCCI|nr:hypothetical protein BN946_scf185011.g3 [Trametes cinnabarina]
MEPMMKGEGLPLTLDDLRMAVSKLKNPDAEVKKEMRLDDENVLSLLHPEALQPYPITLSEKLRSVTITRDKLSKRYGGSPMDTFPRPRPEKVAEHGYDNFMCINLLWNPNGPQVPGHGGLFFTTCPNLEDLGGWTLDAHGARDYEITAAAALTAEQWLALPIKVRSCWTKNIWKKDWALQTRARIHLRRSLVREPTAEEAQHAISGKEKYDHIRPDIIDDAFVAGEECIQTWSMKCVGYNEALQRELIELAKQ